MGENGPIVIASPPLVSTHPRLPGVEVWRGPRSGAHHVIVALGPYTSAQLADLGEWLIDQGREHNADEDCLSP